MTADTQAVHTVLPGPAADRPDAAALNETGKDYAFAWGQREAENNWHRAFHAITLLLLGGAGWAAWSGWSRPAERIYISHDETGRTMAVPGATFAYSPSEVQVKYFLKQFVHLYYTRRKATVATDHPQSLMFLNNPLADKTRLDWQTTGTLRQIASSHYDSEVQIERVALRETQQSPYIAEVDYRLNEVDPASRQVRDWKGYTATIHYELNPAFPDSILQVNPIGLNIVHVRSDSSERRPE